MIHKILFEVGKRVALTPALVAMHAIEESADDVKEHIIKAREAVGVVCDATLLGDTIEYAIKLSNKELYHAWYADFEVCEFGTQFDWFKIPFNEYRKNPLSENHDSHKKFRAEFLKEFEEILTLQTSKVTRNRTQKPRR